MNKLKDCPFCGMQLDVNDEDTLYPSGTAWIRLDDGMKSYKSVRDVPRSDQWCYVVVCQKHYGGCGAEMHGDTKSETVSQWNTRTERK